MGKLWPSIVFLSTILTGLTGCGLKRRIDGERFNYPSLHSRTETILDSEIILATSESEDHLSVSAQLSAQSTKLQKLNANSSGSLSGSSVIFPPGSLAIDMSVTLEEGIDLVSDGVFSELGLPPASAISTALVLSSTPEANAPQPFTISILTTQSTSLVESPSNLFVVYKARDVVENKLYIGALSNDQVSIKENLIVFNVSRFGSYQVFSSESVQNSIEKTTSKPIITKKNSIPKAEDLIVEAPVLNVISSIPENNATNFDIDSDLEVLFDHDIDPASVLGKVSLTSNVTGEVTVLPDIEIQGNKIVINLPDNFSYLTQYTINLASSISGVDGRKLSIAKDIIFETRDIALKEEFPIASANDAVIAGETDVFLTGNRAGQMVLVWLAQSGLKAAFFDGVAWGPTTSMDTTGTKFKAVVTESGKACVGWIRTIVRTKCYNAGTWDSASSSHDIDIYDPSRDFAFTSSAPNQIRLFWFESYMMWYMVYTASWTDGVWSSGTTLSGYLSGSPTIDQRQAAVSNADGKAAITWKTATNDFYAIYGSSSSWGAITKLSTNTDSSLAPPKATMDDDGTAVVVWSSTNTVHNLYWSVNNGSGWSTQMYVHAPARNLGITRAGTDTILIWTDNVSKVQSSIRPEGGAFGFPIDIAINASTVDSSNLNVIGNNKGDVQAFWYQNPTPSYRPNGAAISISESPVIWKQPGNLTPSDCNNYWPSFISIDEHGHGGFTCTRLNNDTARKEALFTRVLKNGVKSVKLNIGDPTKNNSIFGIHSSADGRTWVPFLSTDGSIFALVVASFE